MAWASDMKALPNVSLKRITVWEARACRKKKEEAAQLKALKEKAASKGGFAKVKGSK